MVVGGGHNGAIGGIGVMTLFAAAMTGMGLASRLSGNPAAAVAAEGVGEGAKMLQDRIAAVEAAMGTQGSMATDTSGFGSGSSATGESTAKAGGFDLRSWYGRRSRSGSATSAGGTTAGAAGSDAPSSAAPGGGGKTTAEPPQERPMSADEARGFGPDGNGGVEGQPYTPTSEDQAT